MKRTPATRPGQGRHPIAVVAARTGLSADVLRIWERRYEAVQPTRSADGQRLYSDADVERLRWLRLATAGGRSIGQVAGLPTPALAQLVEEDAAARPPEAADGTLPTGEIVSAALEYTRTLNAPALGMLMRRTATMLGVSAFIEQVAINVLHCVGDEWHAGQLTPAQEHLASSLVQHLIIGAMGELADGNDGPRVVIATPAGERHAIGAALVGTWAAAEKWNPVYLGADLPAADIASSAAASSARVVALSLVYVHDRQRILREMRALRALLPADVSLIVGGAGAATLEPQLTRLGLKVGSSAKDFLAELRIHA